MRHHRTFRSDTELETIFDGLASRTLPKSEWTHAAHFAAALWLVARMGEQDAERTMPGLIRAYNESTGVANTETGGYHETITLASLRAAKAFLDEWDGNALHAAANTLLASPLGETRWPLRYWSEALLFSVAARRRWVAPDLARPSWLALA